MITILGGGVRIFSRELMMERSERKRDYGDVFLLLFPPWSMYSICEISRTAQFVITLWRSILHLMSHLQRLPYHKESILKLWIAK